MAALSQRTGNRAPSTIFSTLTLSPRQIANKAISLGCKKLDRDDKRRRPQYHLGERLLLSITITKAEEVLNKRTRRTNRRVMDAEEDEEAFNVEIQKHQYEQHQHHLHHTASEEHSPLRSCVVDSDDEQDLSQHEQLANKKTKSSLSTASEPLCTDAPSLPSDCRHVLRQTLHNKPIAAV